MWTLLKYSKAYTYAIWLIYYWMEMYHFITALKVVVSANMFNLMGFIHNKTLL